MAGYITVEVACSRGCVLHVEVQTGRPKASERKACPTWSHYEEIVDKFLYSNVITSLKVSNLEGAVAVGHACCFVMFRTAPPEKRHHARNIAAASRPKVFPLSK
jgi:hypothetical protein